MNRSAFLKRAGCLAVLALALPACGGGGGGSAAVPDSVQFSAASYAISEADAAGFVTITVNRTGGAGAVSVNYATSNGTAASGADYTAASGTLSWAAADAAAKTFNVPVAVDAVVEGDETVNLTLSLSSGGAVIGAQKTASVVIGDSSAPVDGVFQFSAPTYTISEGAGATVQATITVTRTSGSAGAVIANVTVSDGTAVDATDYTDPGTPDVVLNWADGDAASKSFTIDILDSASAGASKTVNLALTVPAQAGLPEVGTTNAAVLTILNRDVPGTVRFVSAATSVFESGGSATITVSRIDGTGGAASVEVNVTAGTAVVVTDYVAPVPNPVVLNWADGDFADKSFTIAVTDNAALDGTRTVDLTLQNAGGVAPSAPAAAVLSILDDEPGTVAFTSATYSIAEGGAATLLNITATRTGGSLGVATVDVVDALTGTATSAGDYGLIGTQTLTWGNGVAGSQSFNITINGDAAVEPDETIDLVMQNAVGAALGVPTTAQATITNDDVSTAGQLTFSAAAYGVLENAGTVQLTVSRVGGSTGAVSVTVATSNGTAKSNGKPTLRDFVANTGPLNWADGDSTDKFFTVTINHTVPGEAAETFNVTLSAPTGGATLLAPTVAVVTITDVP